MTRPPDGVLLAPSALAARPRLVTRLVTRRLRRLDPAAITRRPDGVS